MNLMRRVIPMPDATPMRLVTLNLPVEVIAAIGRAARAAGQSPQDIVRGILNQRFAAPKQAPAPDAPAHATAPEGADPPFAVHVAFAEALGWLDLQSRLRAAGFVLRLGEDGVLALHSWPADRRLMNSAEIGQPLADLTLRFRAPFPGQCSPRAQPKKVPPSRDCAA